MTKLIRLNIPTNQTKICVIVIKISFPNKRQYIFKTPSDAGDTRRLLFSIIYVCKPIVFLCFRSY